MTAADNLGMDTRTASSQEPPLGARSHHYDFFKVLRQEIIRTTDQVF
jgi:acetyl-CoA carboxylase carboxyl transferase subunit beta